MAASVAHWYYFPAPQFPPVIRACREQERIKLF